MNEEKSLTTDPNSNISVEETTENAEEETIEENAEKPAEETVVENTKKPAEETVVENTEKPAEETVVENTEKSAEEPAIEDTNDTSDAADADAELRQLAQDMTPEKYSEYMEEIDRQYDERKARRTERLEERKRREHRRKIIRAAVLVLLLGAAGATGWFAARGELPLSSLTVARSNSTAPTEVITEAETQPSTEVPTEVSTEATTEAATETVTESMVEETTVSPTDLGTEDPTASTKNADEQATFDEIVARKPQMFEGYAVDPAEGVTITDTNVHSTYAILVDCNTSEVLAQKEAGAVINPASMTKILTVLVASEHLTQEDLDKTIKISMASVDYAYVNKLSAANFEPNEEVTVRDLFYATILPSGGDAAYALAEYVAGSESKFVDLMNEKLKDIGIADQAHFTNVSGMYDDDHYCTVANMAMILKAAVEDDLCRQVLSCHTYTTTKNSIHPDGITFSNWFLRRIEDRDSKGLVLSAKTGFVAEAGCCAASFCLGEDDRYYICVTGHAMSTWESIDDHALIYRTYIDTQS